MARKRANTSGRAASSAKHKRNDSAGRDKISPSSPRFGLSASPPRDDEPVPSWPPVKGQRVIVDKRVWPTEVCLENGGTGWSGVTRTTMSKDGQSTVVQLDWRDGDGKPAASTRLTLNVLRNHA